jgi:hypothetical protein
MALMEAQSIECTSVPAPVAKWPAPGGELPRHSGALSEQEFEREKARILG